MYESPRTPAFLRGYCGQAVCVSRRNGRGTQAIGSGQNRCTLNHYRAAADCGSLACAYCVKKLLTAVEKRLPTIHQENSALRSPRQHLCDAGGRRCRSGAQGHSKRVIASDDLDSEGSQEFKVEDRPVTVAIDAGGNSIHVSGLTSWRHLIADIWVTVEWTLNPARTELIK